MSTLYLNLIASLFSLSLLTAYKRCVSEAEKEKLLSSIRYGKLKRFVEASLTHFNKVPVMKLKFTAMSQTYYSSNFLNNKFNFMESFTHYVRITNAVFQR